MIPEVDTQKAIVVVIADDTRMTRDLLADALRVESTFTVVSCELNLQALSEAQADVAVLSSGTTNHPLKGCELARELRALLPDTKVILLVEEVKQEVLLEAFRAQIRGVFCRAGSVPDLSKCIQQVHRGQIWVGRNQMQLILDAFAAAAPPAMEPRGRILLSEREQQVVRCVAEGLSNRETADRLGLSEHTIKNYLFRIFDKLGVSRRAELIYHVFSSPALLQTAAPLHEALHLPEDATARLEWCHKAAGKFSSAQLALGELYRDGRGVEKNVVVAYMWFLVAELTSERQANLSRELRLRLRSELKPVELAEAERRAMEWLGKSEASLAHSSLAANLPAKSKKTAANLPVKKTANLPAQKTAVNFSA